MQSTDNIYQPQTPNLGQAVHLEKKHGKIGIVSFIISLVCMLLLFLCVCFAGYLEITTEGGIDETAQAVMLIGLGIMALMAGLFVSFILGVVGLFQANTKKVFAILGSLFSAFSIMGVIGLMILGSA